jgi:hypothetical protein
MVIGVFGRLANGICTAASEPQYMPGVCGLVA